MKKGREEETLTKKGSREIDNLDGGLNATGLAIGGKRRREGRGTEEADKIMTRRKEGEEEKEN